MTKEALEKEAEESSKKAFCIAHTHEDELIYKNGYLAGSEPREKRISDLEAQIEEMKCCGNCCYFNIDKNFGTGNLFCDLMLIKKEYCKNKDHWKFFREIKEND